MEKRTPKTDAVIRERAYEGVALADLGDANFIGMYKDGAVFVDSNEIALVVKVTVKKANFEPYEEVQAYEEKLKTDLENQRIKEEEKKAKELKKK